MSEMIEWAAQRFVEQVMEVAADVTRPSVLYKPDLRADGTKWFALYGPNIMEGVAGYGDTPEEAMQDFDRAWHEMKTPAARVNALHGRGSG